MSEPTEPHSRGCFCEPCLENFTPYKVVRPGASPDQLRRGTGIVIDDATDEQLARIVTAYPTELYVNDSADTWSARTQGTRSVGPDIAAEVSGQWGDGQNRTVTFTVADKSLRRNVPTVRTIIIGDVRTVFDAHYADSNGRGNMNRVVDAGRYRLQTRSLLSAEGTISVAQLLATCEGLIDPVVEIEAGTVSDYGNDGGSYDHGVASSNVIGWELRHA